MSELPEPLVPAEVDIREYRFMMLDVNRLRDSRLARNSKGEEFRAAVLLWCAAWHQVPAASLPDDDSELAGFAGFGRVIKEWMKVKAGAMSGWVLCSDNRWYHPVVAERALEAWDSIRMQEWKRECDRIRKENTGRKERNEPLLEIPQRPAPLSGGKAGRVPTERRRVSGGKPAENPPNETEQNGTESKIEPKPQPQDSFVRVREGDPDKVVVAKRFLALRDELWPGAGRLAAPRMTIETEALAYLTDGAPAAVLWEVIDSLMRDRKDRDPAAPPGSLAAFKLSLPGKLKQYQRTKDGAGNVEGAGHGGSRPAQPNSDDKWGPWAKVAPRLRSFGAGDEWSAAWGPPPGHQRCQIPKAMIVEILGIEHAARIGIAAEGVAS
ncbi:hypothetical protein [Azospirillum argentinense]|uniref:DUF1376 domain-containing protein n=1 Tax=Azospirillum argentinense TaxID=2970906 RepID=UPI0032DEF824